MKDYYTDYWSNGVRAETQHMRRLSAPFESIIERVVAGRSVLETGCGDGSGHSPRLAEIAHSYVGADISPAAVAGAQARGLDVREVPDITDLPFEDETFEVVFCSEVLEHLVFPADAVREMKRLLRPGGRILATVPNTARWRRRLDLLLLGRFHPMGSPDGADRPWADAHLRHFTRSNFGRMFRECGFDDVEVSCVNGSLLGDLPWVGRQRDLHRVMPRVDAALDRVAPSLFGITLVAVATKPAVT